jgi:hypothetical protein
MATQMEAEAVAELLRRYSIIPPSSDGSGARPMHGGHVASLGGHCRNDGAKMITFRIGNVSDSRFCPFEKDEAADTVRRFQDQHLLPRHAAMARMTENLIELAAKMYAYECIDSFVFDDVRLHESDYRIGDAQIFASKVIHMRRPKQLATDEGSRRYDARTNSIEKNLGR